jgi:GT2 family glycosyltransferase
MKVFISVPHTGMFPYQFVHSFFPMMVFTMQKGINIEYELRGSSLVYDARECAAKTVLDRKELDYLLFVDSDMMPPPEMLNTLIEHNKPIVTALAFKRVPDYDPCIFKKITSNDAVNYFDYPKGLTEIAGCGMACCLIKREVIEKTPQPWFTPGKLGEDLSFCKRAMKAGFKIYCDTNLICKHVGTYEVGEEHYDLRRNAGKK